ncbi:hypothetical protein KM043_014311 [Ampulex compressa]|nr:hypothetical protein KM043_014311 [Ampulex compressa]
MRSSRKVDRLNKEISGEKKIPTVVKERKSYCYSCSSPDHNVRQCPEKSRGPKCFQCNEFGHISTACKKRVNCIVSSEELKLVSIRGKEFQALVDFGSDITLLREDQLLEIETITLNSSITCIAGAGNARVRVEGTFEDSLQIDEVTMLKGHVTKIRRITENGREEKFKGTDDREKEGPSNVEESGETVPAEGLLQNTCVMVERELDVRLQFTEKIKQLVDNYKPASQAETTVQTQIRLHDNVPVASRPRRLEKRKS